MRYNTCISRPECIKKTSSCGGQYLGANVAEARQQDRYLRRLEFAARVADDDLARRAEGLRLRRRPVPAVHVGREAWEFVHNVIVRRCQRK